MNAIKILPVPSAILLSLAAVALFFSLQGCATRTIVVHDPGATRVVIKKGHHHGARCGHYKHGKHWYVAKGHVHGKKCGHRVHKGVWIAR